jgi:hypothetical protein
MSGLIWSALGKGIANAGDMVGRYAIGQAEEQNRESRLMQREDRAEARKEAALKRDADIYDSAEKAAPGIGQDRRFAKFKTDLGQTDMSEDELRNVFDSQYNQKKVGDFEGADRYVERYSKEKEDVLNEIRRMGGSSGLINQARDSQKTALTAETAADRLAFDQKKADRKEEIDRKNLEIRDKQVDAIIARGQNTGGGSTKRDYKEADITNAEKALSSARSRIEKSFREPTAQEKYNPQLLAAYQVERDRFVENHPDIKRQTERLERLYSGDSSPPASAPARPGPTRTPASGNRPDLSSFLQR